MTQPTQQIPIAPFIAQGDSAQNPNITIAEPVWHQNKWVTQNQAQGTQGYSMQTAGVLIGLVAMSNAPGIGYQWAYDSGIFNVRAPNGQLVPVRKNTAGQFEDSGGIENRERRWKALSDGTDEVATIDNPANSDPCNTTAYRVASVVAKYIHPITNQDTFYSVGTFDYSQYGYEKIGKIWLDPGNPKDVAIARARAEHPSPASSCYIL